MHSTDRDQYDSINMHVFFVPYIKKISSSALVSFVCWLNSHAQVNADNNLHPYRWMQNAQNFKMSLGWAPAPKFLQPTWLLFGVFHLWSKRKTSKVLRMFPLPIHGVILILLTLFRPFFFLHRIGWWCIRSLWCLRSWTASPDNPGKRKWVRAVEGPCGQKRWESYPSQKLLDDKVLLWWQD